jgi:predicted metal-binding protein
LDDYCNDFKGEQGKMVEDVLKIAILVREETTAKCTGKGCLRSFFAKIESFGRYQDQPVDLIGFFHNGGDLDHKLARMKNAGVQVIHLSSCMRSKDEGYGDLIREMGHDFDVIGYTHRVENEKTISITDKFLDKL